MDEPIQAILAANPNLELNQKVREISDNLDKVNELAYFATSPTGEAVLGTLRGAASTLLAEALAFAVGNQPTEATNALLRLSAHLSLLAEFGSLDTRGTELKELLHTELQKLIADQAS